MNAIVAVPETITRDAIETSWEGRALNVREASEGGYSAIPSMTIFFLDAHILVLGKSSLARGGYPEIRSTVNT